MPGQAYNLVEGIRDSLGPDRWQTEWKYVSIMIGGNNLCIVCTRSVVKCPFAVALVLALALALILLLLALLLPHPLRPLRLLLLLLLTHNHAAPPPNRTQARDEQ
jgi:hypothetical protein